MSMIKLDISKFVNSICYFHFNKKFTYHTLKAIIWKNIHFSLRKPLRKTQNMSEKFNPLKPGGVIFARGKFNFKSFLND